MTVKKQIALFDLDHTLIPFDSDHAWGEQHLEGRALLARHRPGIDLYPAHGDSRVRSAVQRRSAAGTSPVCGTIVTG